MQTKKKNCLCLIIVISVFRLTLTNIEEQVVASNLVHETNCIISMPEFALRLQISVDDPATADLFGIFDAVRNLFMNELNALTSCGNCAN